MKDSNAQLTPVSKADDYAETTEFLDILAAFEQFDVDVCEGVLQLALAPVDSSLQQGSGPFAVAIRCETPDS